MNVLFLSHDASRTGAPLLLLNLVRWLAEHRAVKPTFLLGRSGALVESFAATGPVIELKQTSAAAASSSRSPLNRSVSESLARVRMRLLRERLQASKFDLAYANTVTNGVLHDLLHAAGLPILTHAHEMGFWMDRMVHPTAFRKCLDQSDRFVACSQAVRKALLKRGVPDDRIDVAHSFVDARALAQRKRPPAGEGLRQRLHIPASAFLIGGAGTLGWRKGSDLFLQVAKAVLASQAGVELHFVWFGGEEIAGTGEQLRYEAALAGVESRVHFTGALSDAALLLGELDIFLLTSREDPFPLVMLEAASAGVPVLGFEGTGGVDEFAADGAGALVPGLDPCAMAKAVIELHADAPRRTAIGMAARQKVQSRYDIDVVAPRIYEIMESTIRGHRGPPPNEGSAAKLQRSASA